MNSKVIKFVAGAGKTSYAVEYMKGNRNGLYLAFTNSVVREAREKGYLCLTIDSLFSSFLIAKTASFMPLIASGSRIEHIDSSTTNFAALSSMQIRIDDSGKIFNRSREVSGITLRTPNATIYSMGSFTNAGAIKYIFSRDLLRLSHLQVQGLANFLIANHGDDIIDIIKKRFSYVIIDEAQDLKDYREAFARLLHESDIPITLLGDSNQNVNGGGQWFENLSPDEAKTVSYRCADGVCEWIRDNLGIEIYGTDKEGSYNSIDMADVPALDNGERKLLYMARSGRVGQLVDGWCGPKGTIKSVKGETVDADVVIIGASLNHRNLYTAITRTRGSVYSTVRLA